jgi:hypothetical protein
MTQGDFNLAFQSILATQLPLPPSDPQQIAQEIMRRDRWRTRILAWLCILFWLLGSSGMMLLVYALNRLVIFLRIAPGLPWNASLQAASQPAFPPSAARGISDWGTQLIHHSTPYIEASVVCLMLAAIFTVMLIFSSRKATLNRITLSLMQISEQLRQLRSSERASA